MLVEKLLMKGASSVAAGTRCYLHTWGVQPIPAQPQSGTIRSWTAIASDDLNGTFFGITSTELGLYSWGREVAGQLGQNQAASGIFPPVGFEAPVRIGTNSWTAVDAGDGFATAIRADGTLWGWGCGLCGRAGLSITTNRSSPVQITVGTGSWTAVAAGAFIGLAIANNGTLWGWGGARNSGSGIDCGGFSTTPGCCDRPVQISNCTNWSRISTGPVTGEICWVDGHSLALDTLGRLYAWGSNGCWELGVNRQHPVGRPVNTCSVSSTTRTIAAGRYAIASILNPTSGASSGFLSTAGCDPCFATGRCHCRYSTTLDNGLLFAQKNSMHAIVNDRCFNVVSLGSWHGLAIDQFSSLFAWGRGDCGELGLNRRWKCVQNRSVGNIVLALDFDNKLWVWGANCVGELGLNCLNGGRVDPVQVGTSSWTAISGGLHGAQLAIRSDGALFTWGCNLYGQLGLNDTINRSSPTQVGTSSWTAVATGQQTFGAHSLAIRLGGNLFAWGYSFEGQLGNNSTTNQSSPVQIGSGTWCRISAGDGFTTAILTTGEIFSWGCGGLGRLGNGVTTNRSSPQQIGTSSWSAVCSGLCHTVALRNNGTLWAWGGNGSGRLGNGSTINQSSPVQVAGSWLAISAGGGLNGISHAISTTGGRLWAWGDNSCGHLGDGTSTSRCSPVAVGTSCWIMVESGWNRSFAIRGDNTLWVWGNSCGGGTNPTFICTPVFGNNSLVTSIASPVMAGTGVINPVRVSNDSWIAVSAGARFSLGIKLGNTLWAWGENNGGQLGIGAASTTCQFAISPVQIGSGTTWCVVEAGNCTGAAIRGAPALATGELFIWGFNTQGQLGDSTTISKSSPIQVGVTQGWTDISLGVAHALAACNGGLTSWGCNNQGQLGNGDSVTRSSPVVISGVWTGRISAHLANHNLAVKSGGALWSWGCNIVGQLGDSTATSRASPVLICAGATSWGNVAAGLFTSMAVQCCTITNQCEILYAWGDGASAAVPYYPSLGQRTPRVLVETVSPTQIGTSSWSAIAAGPRVSYAIRSDNTLWGWGAGGQLPFNDNLDRSSPTQVGAGTWCVINATCAAGVFGVTTTGSLFQWRGNVFCPTVKNILVPSSPVQIGSAAWKTTNNNAIMAGNSQCSFYGIQSDLRLYSWGGPPGQLGQGWRFCAAQDTTTICLRDPIAVVSNCVRSSPTVMGSLSWSAVASGANHFLAIRGDRTLWSWGYNADGQLGLNDILDRSSPTQVGTSQWTAISAGQWHSLAIRSGGNLFAWGSNNCIFGGQLGDQTIVSKSSPVQIGSGTWNRVAAGVYHSLAVSSTGTLWGWGQNGCGQLGQGTTTLLCCSPVSVGSSSWSAISAGCDFSAAIRSDGALFTWGFNCGAIGDNTFTGLTHRSSPVQIGTNSWSAVSAGTVIVHAIRSDGTLWGWGCNAGGQVGVGTTTTTCSPVQIGANTNWSILPSTRRDIARSAAITNTGDLYAWGSNEFGILGDGTTICRCSPVQIGSGVKKWSEISFGCRQWLGRQDI